MKKLAELIQNAEKGIAPSDEKDWLKVDCVTGNTIAHIYAKNATLPKDFPYWDAKNGYGEIVANIAALYNHLPEDFDQWTLIGYFGRTVAHIVASKRVLPADFKYWHLETALTKIPVAHMAAMFGTLPDDFDQWNMPYGYGTVRDIVESMMFDEYHVKKRIPHIMKTSKGN